jgi:predicted hotdog family 3-hydroxylacyl-ACP dehydratase
MTSEEKQRIYDTFLMCDRDVKVTASIVGFSQQWTHRVAMRMEDNHNEAVQYMEQLNEHVITDKEILSRYFYNPKYPVSKSGVITNCL